MRVENASIERVAAKTWEILQEVAFLTAGSFFTFLIVPMSIRIPTVHTDNIFDVTKREFNLMLKLWLQNRVKFFFSMGF
jgi:hypothetical protein